MSSVSQIAIQDVSPSGGLPAKFPWSPDCGDGTYKNPVLFADYSDPDAICVGDEFWMTSSSFCHVPGLPLLRSKDLVNWSLENHALKKLPPGEHFSVPRPGCGVWAPSLRHHDGLFWIFFPDPDFGIWVITAKDPRGDWSAPRMLKEGKGLIDPCPLWDDDGRAYLIHGWAKSRSGVCNLLTLHEMAPDASRLLDEGRTVVDANKMEGWHTLEGPKLYKRGGWYYVFAPAGGVSTGYQAVFRSRDIQGPYEAKIVLEQGSTPINGPHQGAWVETGRGEHWFLHFQELPAYGRVVHLQPMKWTPDGWPAMGAAAGEGRPGVPVLRHRKPKAPEQSVATPPCSDSFPAGKPGLQWQWQANPCDSWLKSTDGKAGLRLVCVSPGQGAALDKAGNLLMQKFPAPVFTATAKLTLSPASKGDAAGLVVFGADYCRLGLEWDGQKSKLVQRVFRKGENGDRERAVFLEDCAGSTLWLRVEVSEGAVCRFSFSADGCVFRSLTKRFAAKSGRWVGAKLGLFAVAEDARSAGGASVEFFSVA